jgi:uncharacterized low-complexity protein
MKKISLLLAAVAFSVTAFAQNSTKMEATPTAQGSTVKHKTTTHNNGTTKSSASNTTQRKTHPATTVSITHTKTSKEN